MKGKLVFPDPRQVEIEEDVIAIGGLLNSENILNAYNKGIFPWPHGHEEEEIPMLWFCPEKRGILEFENLHISKSMKKWMKKNASSISITINQAFLEVIQECQKLPRKDQDGTWITEEIVQAYSGLSRLGKAISLECWQNGELISGIYGVFADRYFSCESMFFKKPNASKYAFIKLVEYLREVHKMRWMDIQMVTEISGALGGTYITRDAFLERILE